MNSLNWPARPFLFAVLGAVTAIAAYQLIGGLSPNTNDYNNLKVAVTGAIVTFSFSFSVSARREKIPVCVLYAIILAAIVGGIFYWRLVIQWPELFGFIALGLTVFIVPDAASYPEPFYTLL